MDLFIEYVQELRAFVGHRPLILTGSVVLIVMMVGGGFLGGLMDLGESLEVTARREVKEETGVDIGELNY